MCLNDFRLMRRNSLTLCVTVVFTPEVLIYDLANVNNVNVNPRKRNTVQIILRATLICARIINTAFKLSKKGNLLTLFNLLTSRQICQNVDNVQQHFPKTGFCSCTKTQYFVESGYYYFYLNLIKLI